MVIILLVLGAPLVPALIWRAGVSREARAALEGLSEAGRPLTMAQLNAQFPPLAIGENRADDYITALADLRAVTQSSAGRVLYQGIECPAPGDALAPEVREATADWVGENRAVLDAVGAASGRSGSRFVQPYVPAGYNDLARLGQLEVLSDLTCAAAVVAADQGDGAALSTALFRALDVAASPDRDGLYTALVRQWEMERQFLEALQYGLSRIPVDDEVLAAVEQRFGAGRRLEQIRHMVVVEQCLFLGRIREGRRRGMARNLLIASGVGDLNISAHVRLMNEILKWTDVSAGERGAIEERFDSEMKRLATRPLLFLTLNVSRPPGYWKFYNRSLDEAALVRVALALYRYHRAQGRFPLTLDQAGAALPAPDRQLPSTGEPVHYRLEGEKAILSNRAPSLLDAKFDERHEIGRRDPELARFELLMPPVAAP